MSKYYHVTSVDFGLESTFEPVVQHPQVVLENGEWIIENANESTPVEIAFSKGIVNDFFSNAMLLKENVPYYIYETEEEPTTDLSEIQKFDFPAVKEVRYAVPVKVKKVGTVVPSEEFLFAISMLYESCRIGNHLKYFNHEYALESLNTHYGKFIDEIEWEDGCRCAVLG